MSVQTVNCLEEHKVQSIGDLVKKKQEALLSIPNFGEKTLQECIDLLDRLKVPNPGWEIATKKNKKPNPERVSADRGQAEGRA